MTSLQTCLIKILPLICSFFSTEDDIPTNMSYQDTTLDLQGFLYRSWHPYKYVLSKYYPWCVIFSLQKMTSLQTCLIKILPLICSFFFTEDDIPTNMSYQDTTLDLYFFLYRRWHPYKHVLSRYYPWFVVFSLQKVTSLQTCLIKILPLICIFFFTEDDIPTNM
jgi:uncharacterized membrane protein